VTVIWVQSWHFNWHNKIPSLLTVATLKFYVLFVCLKYRVHVISKLKFLGIWATNEYIYYYMIAWKTTLNKFCFLSTTYVCLLSALKALHYFVFFHCFQGTCINCAWSCNVVRSCVNVLSSDIFFLIPWSKTYIFLGAAESLVKT